LCPHVCTLAAYRGPPVNLTVGFPGPHGPDASSPLGWAQVRSVTLPHLTLLPPPQEETANVVEQHDTRPPQKSSQRLPCRASVMPLPLWPLPLPCSAAVAVSGSWARCWPLRECRSTPTRRSCHLPNRRCGRGRGPSLSLAFIPPLAFG